MWKGNALLSFLAIPAFTWLDISLGGNAFVSGLRTVAVIGLAISLSWGLVLYLSHWVPTELP